MSDIALYLEGAATGLICYGIGVLSGRRRRKADGGTPSAPDLTCGCEHELSYHDPETNQCHATQRQARYNSNGVHTGWVQVQCTCRQYTGPKPIDQVFQPRIAWPKEEA